jgi:hypothetical protein
MDMENDTESNKPKAEHSIDKDALLGTGELNPDDTARNPENGGENSSFSTLETITIARVDYERNLAEARVRETQLANRIAILQDLRKEDMLRQAVNSWAVDPEAVLALTRDRFGIDAEGSVFPMDDRGVPLQINGQRIDLVTFFQNFQQEKPYLVKASQSQGAGSFTQTAGETSFRSLDRLAELSMTEFIQAGGLSGK